MSMTRNTECQRKTSSFSLLISLVLPPAAMGYRNDFGGKASKIVLRNQISNKCFHLFKPSQHLSLYRQTDICWLRHYAEGSFVSLFFIFLFLKSWHTQSVEWGVSEWKATQIVCDYTENTEPFSAQMLSCTCAWGTKAYIALTACSTWVLNFANSLNKNLQKHYKVFMREAEVRAAVLFVKCITKTTANLAI